MGFLTDVVRASRAALAARPLDHEALWARLARIPQARDLAAALAARPPSVIGEVKRASPSAGTIAKGADPAEQALAYQEGGAAAISVLTEPIHFGGSLADLVDVRAAVSLPVLRKDFLVHPDQVLEARAHGADSVLLITACLDDDELAGMVAASRGLGMEPLVETHSGPDLSRALAADARIVGVNARDLETLDVDLGSALDRLRSVPTDRVAVLESGISSRAHVEDAMAAGASAILVGETLMRAADPAAAIRRLRGAT
jgi:indole-3-glycerol phosphate synthase